MQKEKKKLCASDASLQYIDSEVKKPVIKSGNYKGRIAVTGFGPAGLFCALVLSENGYRPIVFERGETVDDRARSVERFWNGGPLNISSNVQFGEGGAGTFSDGKLTTRIKDPFCRYVLESFVKFGAPEEILFRAKPHIGTDKLKSIIKRMREQIMENGGEVHFNTTVTGFETDGSRICRVKTDKGDHDAAAVVMAVGNSARDTFEMLFFKQHSYADQAVFSRCPHRASSGERK
ncbi:NAD(P)/FAD-dependent oxidoreductase [Ruminococcus sp. HUN007]|uniref:NAD(P)/FAD-dependent oxidoreductase n=1 Tax=Ruminococcus sp. HUN007 TaxID=1514668 RepID=UPI001FA700AC|nr:NAD(P)/FAD-dependent oxidoreductase [Ruminococcus sp. HUN007]